MNVLETDWWLLSLPEDWHAEQDDDAIVVVDPDDIGELMLTTLVAEDSAAVDLQALLRDSDIDIATAEPVTAGDFSGFVAESTDTDAGEFLREWFLARDQLVVIASYVCDDDNRTLDRDMVSEILSTLGVKASSADS